MLLAITILYLVGFAKYLRKKNVTKIGHNRSVKSNQRTLKTNLIQLPHILQLYRNLIILLFFFFDTYQLIITKQTKERTAIKYIKTKIQALASGYHPKKKVHRTIIKTIQLSHDYCKKFTFFATKFHSHDGIYILNLAEQSENFEDHDTESPH